MLLWVLCAAAGLCLLLLFLHPHIPQDVQIFLRRLKARRSLLKYMKTNYLPLDRFLERVQVHPHRPLLLYRDATFTFLDADILSNKAARALLQDGLVKPGDTVALLVGNEPVFLWLWLALVKLGCTAAFLNHNIRSTSLLHCFSCCGATALLAAEELQDAVEEVLPSLLEQQVSVFILADESKTAGVQSFRDKMSRASSEPLPRELRSHLTLQSPAIYIYTSGTTGLPKAAVVTYARLWNISLFSTVAGVTSKDVIYTTLPLYHSAGFLAFVTAIEKGLTMVLRSKFSASQFWDDCRKYNVTVIQYIGEILRYLCNTPQKPNDRNHKVRLALGNGLRADVWRDFIRRFGNIHIREFYAATEGNFSLLNYSNKIGSIGRNTFLNRRIFSLFVIKYDVDKDEPIRDSSGVCVKAAKGEPGLLVSKITLKTPFTGYLGNLQQTERKKLHDVCTKGDLYFNTGDLVRIDEDDFMYFVDRVGDTFRWKGENVATMEVADVVAMAECVKEANVYGIKVPGHEGRVGMAAISLRDGQKFDSAAVCKQVIKFLPTYARPRFMRIQSSIDVTNTFKHSKVKLVREGFNLKDVTDPLYILDERQNSYIPLTADISDAVVAGQIRL